MTTLIFAHSFTEKTAASVSRQLRHYQQITPGIVIEEKILTNSSLASQMISGSLVPDIFIWDGPVSKDLPFPVSKTFHWTGDLWTLIVNPQLLDPQSLEDLAEGTDMDGFTEILQKVFEKGISPLSVGNSHNWPLVIWEQHLEATLSNKPDSIEEPDLEYFSQIRSDTWDLLRFWNDSGYFLDEVWDAGWARGLAAVIEGKAAMALMSGSMFSTIPADLRENYLYLPFPRSGKAQWAIGSGSSLILNDGSEVKSESEKILNYLTSEAVAQILTDELNTMFYSSANSSTELYIPSWELMANSEEMREFGRALEDFVRAQP